MANNNQNIIMGSELMVKLNLTNFLEWEAKLVEIVKLNGLEYVLSHPMPSYYARDMTPERFYAWDADLKKVMSLMLNNIPDDWARRFVAYEPFTLIKNLRDICRGSTEDRDLNVHELIESMSGLKVSSPNRCYRMEVQETHVQLLRTKQRVGVPLRFHVDLMCSYFDRLSLLGTPISERMAVSVLLNSLHSGFGRFKQLYLSEPREETVAEFVHLVRKAEIILDCEAKDLLKARKRPFKKGGKSKGNAKSKQDKSTSSCLYCDGIGHYKRECPKLKEDQKNGIVVPSSGIFVIDCTLVN